MKTQIDMGMPTLLLISFIILKLCGVIEWSWLWVLSPFWIPVALIAVIGVCWIGCKIFMKFYKYLSANDGTA